MKASQKEKGKKQKKLEKIQIPENGNANALKDLN